MGLGGIMGTNPPIPVAAAHSAGHTAGRFLFYVVVLVIRFLVTKRPEHVRCWFRILLGPDCLV
jgi:hypothetical protein